MPRPPRKRSSLETLLAELRAVRDDPGGADAPAVVRRALAGPGVAAGAAAALIVEHGLDAEAALLEPAFARLLAGGLKADPGCKGKEAIAEALVRLGLPAGACLLRGVRWRQLEPVWGGRQDTAAGLRGVCAAGLAQLAHPDAAVEIAELLADPEWVARAGAARALGWLPAALAEPLLRFKLRIGDTQPGVLGDCFRGLLACAPSAVDRVAAALGEPDEAIAEQAALALGESRLPAALEPLRRWLDEASSRSARRIALLALAMLRTDASRQVVLDTLAQADPATAAHALDALAIYRHEPALRDQALAIVRSRRDPDLTDRATEVLRVDDG